MYQEISKNQVAEGPFPESKLSVCSVELDISQLAVEHKPGIDH